MEKALVSEKVVKEALGIEKFSNISKEKIMEFVSLIPDMDKDLAMQIIEQFPSFVDSSKYIMEQLRMNYESALVSNDKSQKTVLDAYRKMLDDLGEVIKKDNISESERREIIQLMVEIADKMALKDTENKDFIKNLTKYVTKFGYAALVVGAAILGVKVKGGTIPKIKY